MHILVVYKKRCTGECVVSVLYRFFFCIVIFSQLVLILRHAFLFLYSWHLDELRNFLIDFETHMWKTQNHLRRKI